jgi:hypothetical protein
MRKYNQDDYEPVEHRIKRFLTDHKDGRILTYLESDPNNMDYAVFRAHVEVNGTLLATGWSQAIRDKELSVSKGGQEYESVNYTSWLENAETSAIGRALANAGYQGSKRASREEMQKAGDREEAGQRESEQVAARNRALVVELEAELEKAKGIVEPARIEAMKAQMAKMATELAGVAYSQWLNKAIDKVRGEVDRQQALLKVSANPVGAAMSKLQAAAEKTDRVAPAEVKQKELV